MVNGDFSRSPPLRSRSVVTAEPAGSAASRPAPGAAELIDRFAGRYTNPGTSRQYRAELTALLAYAGVSHPRALTDAAVNHWVVPARANNSRCGRLARVCTFLRWWVRHGEAHPALVEEPASRDNPLRATPPLHGKLQGKYPARWLTHTPRPIRPSGDRRVTALVTPRLIDELAGVMARPRLRRWMALNDAGALLDALAREGRHAT